MNYLLTITATDIIVITVLAELFLLVAHDYGVIELHR